MGMPNAKRGYYFKTQHRLKTFNYSSATSYFLTFNTRENRPVLSKVQKAADGGAVVVLTPIGAVADKYVKSIESHYENVSVDAYVVMPTHVHLLLTVTKTQAPTNQQSSLIAKIIRSTKTLVSKEIGEKIWQDDYYDIVADTDRIYDRCYDYSRYNPIVWLTRGGAEPDEGDFESPDDLLPPE